MVCEACQPKIETIKKRLPKGWKRREEELFCFHLWREAYLLRAITVQVASPLTGTWEQFREALKAMWIETTACSNWMVTELYTRDVRRNGEEKMPPMPHSYLYPEARVRFPRLPSQSVASLEQAVTRKYKARRYEVVWTAMASLPIFRYPTPFPVHNQSWNLTFDNGGRPVVSARVGESRWEFRLRGGPRYHRQLSVLRQLVAGVAVAGELSIFKTHNGEIMAKMATWMPRREASPLDGTLSVRTTSDSLLVAVDQKDERIWVVNGDHIRRWISEYERKRHRLSEDRKAEQRPVASFTGRWDDMVVKQRNRMRSALQEVAAQLAGLARRRKFALVQYDDRERGFVEPFPWFELKEKLKGKLDEYGIGFQQVTQVASDGVTPVGPLLLVKGEQE